MKCTFRNNSVRVFSPGRFQQNAQWKHMKRSDFRKTIGIYASACLEGLRRTTNYTSQGSKCPSRDLNLIPTKYKSETLQLEANYSVFMHTIYTQRKVHYFGYVKHSLLLAACLGRHQTSQFNSRNNFKGTGEMSSRIEYPGTSFAERFKQMVHIITTGL